MKTRCFQFRYFDKICCCTWHKICYSLPTQGIAMHFLLTVQITIRLSLVRQLKMSKQRDLFNFHLKGKLNEY